MAQVVRSWLPGFHLPAPPMFLNRIQRLFRPGTVPPPNPSTSSIRGAGKKLLARAGDARPYSIPLAIGRTNSLRRARERLARPPPHWPMDVDKQAECFDMEVDEALPSSHSVPVAVASCVPVPMALSPALALAIRDIDTIMAPPPPPSSFAPLVTMGYTPPSQSLHPAVPPSRLPQPQLPCHMHNHLSSSCGKASIKNTAFSALPSSSGAFFSSASSGSHGQAPQAGAFTQNPQVSPPAPTNPLSGPSPMGNVQQVGAGVFGRPNASMGLPSTSGAPFASASSWYLHQASRSASAVPGSSYLAHPTVNTSAAFTTWRSPSGCGGNSSTGNGFQRGGFSGASSFAGPNVLQAPLPISSGAISSGGASIWARRK